MNEPENNHFGPSNWELYKRLELKSFMEMNIDDPKIEKLENPKSNDKYTLNAWIDKSAGTILSSPESQQKLFSQSMRVIIFVGQLLGLNPVMGILQEDFQKMSFKILSWNFFYSFLMSLYQGLGTILCVVRMCKTAINIKPFSSVCFYLYTVINTILFILTAKKWPGVIREITNSKLDEYVNPRLRIQCTVFSIVLLILAPIEYILLQIATYSHKLNCTPSKMFQDVYTIFTLKKYSWLFDIVPYSPPLGILIHILNFITTMNWHYSDIFVACVCLYLISIFGKINKKIESAQNKQLQPWFWRSVREDYTRTTRLVRLFDDVMCGITFVSIANDLFFICLQIFNIFQNKTKKRFPPEECPNFSSGPFNGNESTIYFAFSIFTIICRFLSVSLLASRVHSAATQPSTVLHEIPTKFYCTEIQRFVEQIHSDVVALSGLQFFHITRSLILSVAGTIITYELVLLQFDDDDKNNL